MHLFSRSVTLAGPLADVRAYVTGMCEYVSGKTGQEVGLWSMVFGAPVGTYVFAVRVEGIAGLQAMTSTFIDDDEYHARLAEGRSFATAPAEDMIGEPVHGELGDPPPVGSMATITTAQIANGAYAEAIGWGVDLSQHVEQVTGIPVMFLLNSFGPFGGVTWIGVGPDAATADKANAAINADADYVTKLGAVADLFVAGSGHRSLAMRIA